MNKEIAQRWLKQALHDLEIAEKNIPTERVLKGIFADEGKHISRIHHTEDYWIDRFEVEVLPRLVREFSPESVFIFGSRVQGTADDDWKGDSPECH